MNSRLNVQAIFDSIDGEENAFGGAGELTTFIRLKGCQLRCSYCDTQYAQESKPENWMTIDEIIQQIHFPKITITGGEPLLQKEGVEELCNKLIFGKFCEVSIETNGTIQPTYYLEEEDVVRYIVDFKLPSSGMLEHMNTEVFKNLRPVDVIKFVIADDYDYKYALTVIEQNPSWKAKMVFSPAVSITFARSRKISAYLRRPVYADLEWARQLAEMMIRDKVPAQFSLQLHKILWPGAKEER